MSTHVGECFSNCCRIAAHPRVHRKADAPGFVQLEGTHFQVHRNLCTFTTACLDLHCARISPRYRVTGNADRKPERLTAARGNGDAGALLEKERNLHERLIERTPARLALLEMESNGANVNLAGWNRVALAP